MKILRQSEQLKAINQEIEKINTNLEKTIEAKNKLLTEYAYFNSHQVRGPLACIPRLIQIINIEYKEHLDGHANAFAEGNDLDAAIHKINELIDDVSERHNEV